MPGVADVSGTQTSRPSCASYLSLSTVTQDGAAESYNDIEGQQQLSPGIWLNMDDCIFFAQFYCTCAHFLYKLPRWVSFCPNGVSICPEYHHQPLFSTQPSQTQFWNMYLHKTPPSQPQNTPFPGLNLNCPLFKHFAQLGSILPRQ